MLLESRQCPRCGNYDSMVPLIDESNDELTTKHGDRSFSVKQFRCVACGLNDLVQRDANRASSGAPDPLLGEAAPSDGRIFIAGPADVDPSESEGLT